MRLVFGLLFVSHSWNCLDRNIIHGIYLDSIRILYGFEGLLFGLTFL